MILLNLSFAAKQFLTSVRAFSSVKRVFIDGLTFFSFSCSNSFFLSSLYFWHFSRKWEVVSVSGQSSVHRYISSEIPHTDIDFRDSLQDYNFTDTFFLPPLTPGEIKEITLGLKLTGGGHLEIPAKMFKIIFELISLTLSSIFNK